MEFTGFTAAAGDFFTELAANNNREFFTAHRDVYDRVVRHPLDLLLGEAEGEYGPGRVMRPNRDVRFSADKSPYRIGASMWAGTVGGVYLNLQPGGIDAGGGLYGPSRDQLERGRRAIDAKPTAAAELAGIVRQLETDGFELAGPSLTTSPKGFARDHPHIALLRLRHYAAVTQLPIDASADAIYDVWSRVKPLIEWTDTHVGAATSRP
ncbi:DUF2461 domain-containing protein [Lacisediminihabitans sp. H27-G8]|uniref:DUF2461 domain-containing protein n=1 Tax=Lacisediminihabitans sp. H27-G8 TaxID=3111909 RepID=UPI0038FC01E8